ncbi:MAG: motility protein A [Anaerolineae bacterium]|nr:motility protein A [Anaerolineae bacterium]
MDIATVGGLILAVVVVVTVLILDGGSPAELIAHPSAILLTLGGSLVATAITVPLEVTMRLPALIKVAAFQKKENPQEIIEMMAVMADKARREGLLALEEEARKLEDPFLRKGIMMVVDGVEPAQVRTILELEIHNMEGRHAQGYGFFNAAGGFSPTFGIIGTVMGLISVLKNLSDPDSLAKSIAAAFLATLWGLISANLLFLPLGGKLLSKSHEEVVFRRMLLEGILSLQAGENPRLIRDKLNVFLAPKARAEEGKAGAKAEAKA